MKERDLIKAELEFQLRARPRVLGGLLGLPQELRPTHQSLGENEAGTVIGDANKLAKSFENGASSIFLRNSNVLYDIRKSRNETLICNAYFERSSSSVVKDYLVQMAMADLIFGFACTPEEKAAKNRVTTRQGVNTIESWVGRDTEKYVPGMYWLTVLSIALAEKHAISLSTLEGVALEHVKLEGEQHLFRFYEEPEDWRYASRVAELCSSLAGVFDVEKVRPQLTAAKTFLDLNAVIESWK